MIESFAADIKAVREKRGLTLREAATRLGVSHSHLCNIEQGKRDPSLKLIQKVCQVYGLQLQLTEVSNSEACVL